jgi:ribosomal protein S18 acetylase RimI-like enzyme
VDAVLAFWRDATTGPSSTDDVDGVRKLLAHAPGSLLVATDDADGTGPIVGTVIAGWDGWRGTMYRLAVARDQRRKGIARALVRDSERWLVEHGARRLHLIVDEHQPEAEAFWAAAGYQPSGQTRFMKTLTTAPDAAATSDGR